MQILLYRTRSPQLYHISIITTHVVITRKICRYNEKRSRYYEKICRFNEKRSRYNEKICRFNEKRSRYYEKRSRYNDIIEWKNIMRMAVLLTILQNSFEISKLNSCIGWKKAFSVPLLLDYTFKCNHLCVYKGHMLTKDALKTATLWNTTKV